MQEYHGGLFKQKVLAITENEAPRRVVLPAGLFQFNPADSVSG